jgi:hypothetical protein
MTGPLQGREGGDHRGVEVGQRGHRHPSREGGRVELVVGVEREDHVEDPRQLGRRLPPLQQIEELGGVRAAPGRRHRFEPAPEALPGGDGLRDEIHESAGLVEVGLGRASPDIGIRRRRQGDGRAHDVERMGITGQPAEQGEHRGRQAAGGLQAGGEAGGLGWRRQVPEPEQVGHRLEAGGLDQLADLVAAVVQTAGLAVDRADGRARGDDVLESRLPTGHGVLPDPGVQGPQSDDVEARLDYT